MDNTTGVRVQNWFGDVISFPKVVVHPRSVDEIIAVLKDRDKYPSPIRAVGSNHSTTPCGTADGGTLLDMSRMNRILRVDPDRVTAEAGALYIDVAQELRKHKLQFHVNVELGNLSIGSAACGGTKDASMPGELGQVSSYAIGIKLVTPAGELLEVTEDQPELLQVMHSSYGLLGVIYAVTFRVRPLQTMAVEHITYTLLQFVEQLPALIARNESMMLYLFPFQDAVTVEYRRYSTGGRPSRAFVWRLRNWVWETKGPLFGAKVTRYIPNQTIRYFLTDRFNYWVRKALNWVVRGSSTIPTDQMIRYPPKGGWSRYTFSLWAFPEASYPRVLADYFAFCQEYYRAHGYRCDLPNVGYRICEDRSSLLSYSYHGTVMTVDPVSTGNPGWEDFLKAYNEFCSMRGGVPLFNQTWGITRAQAERAFGERLAAFRTYLRRFDPEDRLLNDYFREYVE